VLAVGTIAAFSVSAASAKAAAPSYADLGSASTFSTLSAAATTFTGGVIGGDVGAVGAITNTGADIKGVQHASNDQATQNALADAMTAYNNMSTQAPTGVLPKSELGGQVVTPGVYHSNPAFTLTGTLTFDAGNDPNAYFIMVTDAAMTTAGSSQVALIRGALATHIIWVLGAAATLGATSNFNGTILGNAAVTIGSGSTLCGTYVSLPAAVTMTSDDVCSPEAVTSLADLAFSEPDVPAIAPGGNGVLNVVATNNGPQSLDNNDQVSNLIFKAPGDSNFYNNSVSATYFNGERGPLSACVLSNSSTVLTCKGPYGLSQLTPGAGSATSTAGSTGNFALTVAMPASELPGQTLAGGTASATEGVINGRTWNDNNQANNTNVPLSATTPGTAPAPLFASLGVSLATATAIGAGLLIVLLRRRKRTRV